MKIKITSQEKVLNGKIIKGEVKPFGTSAHIPFSKKHMGKKINVIVPDKDEDEIKMVWVLSEKERDIAVKDVAKWIKQHQGRTTHHELEIADNIKENDFSLLDLQNFINILENINPKLADKIRRVYGI